MIHRCQLHRMSFSVGDEVFRMATRAFPRMSDRTRIRMNGSAAPDGSKPRPEATKLPFPSSWESASSSLSGTGCPSPSLTSLQTMKASQAVSSSSSYSSVVAAPNTPMFVPG